MSRDAAADWARQAHAPRDAERDRLDELNVFGRNVDGAAEPASPLNRGRSSGGGDPASVVILPGHHLRVEASAGHPLDGTAVEWDTVVRDDDWGVALGAGKSSLTFPSTACFDFGDLEVEFAGSAEWAGEATVTVKVNGEVRWEATGYGNDNGLSWSSGMLGAVTEGDTWSLHVDAPGAPSPTVVRLSMQRVEPQGTPVDEPDLPTLGGYTVALNTDQDVLVVQRTYDGGPWEEIARSAFTASIDTWYWIRARVDGTRIRGKIWSGAKGDEPASWTVDHTDGDAHQGGPGHPGVGIKAGSDSVRDVDRFEVSLDGGTWQTTDFTEYSTGSPPSDWDRLLGSTTEWEVALKDGIPGSNVLQHDGAASSSTALTWRCWTGIGNGGDMDVYARVRVADFDSGIQIVLRANAHTV